MMRFGTFLKQQLLLKLVIITSDTSVVHLAEPRQNYMATSPKCQIGDGEYQQYDFLVPSIRIFLKKTRGLESNDRPNLH